MVYSHISSEIEDSRNADVHYQLHDRHTHDDQLFSGKLSLADCLGVLLEALLLVFLTGKSLYYADTYEVFLHLAVHGVVLLEHFLKARMCL